MTTLHERAAHDFLFEQMADERTAGLLSLWARRMCEDESVQDGFAVYGQTHPRAGRWRMEQMCCAVAIHSFINAGYYAVCPLLVGSTPGPDADRAENAAALDGLRRPFRAEVDMEQSGGDQDGQLVWSSPTFTVRSTGVPLLTPPHGAEEAVVMPKLITAGSAPLEIGYTWPSRTLAHLRMDGAVARWPYGSDVLTLIVNLDRGWAVGRDHPFRGVL